MKTKPVSQTLGAMIEEIARETPNAPALSFNGQTYSFAEIRAQTRAAAKALRRSGVKSGDRVGLLLGNCTEWVVLDFALQYLGATMVALNTWYTEKELSYVVEHSDISTLVLADKILKTDYIEMLQPLLPLERNFPKLRKVVMLGERRLPGAQNWGDFLAAGADVSDDEVLTELSAVSPGAVAYQLYTSGSTARPKGVMLIHKYLIENAYQLCKRMGVDASDVIYMPLSLFWGMGCMNMLIGPWTFGAHIVLQEQFIPEEGLELIDKYRCSVFSATANVMHAIFEHPAAHRYDLSSMRKGTPVGTPEATLKIVETVMPSGSQIYGLTETHGLVTLSEGDYPLEKRVRTEGRPTPGWEVRIVDPDTETVLPPDQMGEIRVRGRMMVGYYKNPEATAEAFDAEGFFKTGDLGLLDESGYLSFKGRLKEMLKTGGINVAPMEVEEVLLSHPAVGEAYVTGLPDEVQGEIVVAVIVPKTSMSVTAAEILGFCQKEMAKYKIPRQVLVVGHNDIPLTSTTKVHRMKLAQLFRRGDGAMP